jgi:hypothetical protein
MRTALQHVECFHLVYGTPEAWDRICELVVDRLTGLAG